MMMAAVIIKIIVTMKTVLFTRLLQYYFIFSVILFVKDLSEMRFHFVPLFARSEVMKIKHFPCHYITNHSLLSISEPNKINIKSFRHSQRASLMSRAHMYLLFLSKMSTYI